MLRRTKSKCDKLKEELQDKTKTIIHTAKVDANNVDELVALMQDFKPEVVLNLALPYQDLKINGCLFNLLDVIISIQQTNDQKILPNLVI